jgi:Leucine-rich repeat (LRR) protein
MGECPSLDQLRQLLADQLSGPPGEAVEAHLQACRRCQQALERITSASDSPAGGGVPRPFRPQAAQTAAANFLHRLEKKPPGATRVSRPGQHEAAETIAPGPTRPLAPLPARSIAGYELLAELGRGGMGVVYKARQVRLGRVVALKVIPKERMTDPGLVRRFRREIQAAAQLSHPNVVRAYDAGEAEGTHFFAMEYVEGSDLASLLRKQGRLPVDRACDYIRQASLGLQHAWQCGLVHRDIKPHNLLLSAQGVLKVADLGLVRLHETAPINDRTFSTLTEEGMLMGTPDYLAPEQTNDAHSADIRSDLYSLGCTLYHLLTGRVPFPEGGVLDKLFKHVSESPTPLRKLSPEVPVEVAAVVDKLMAKRPEDRYQTPAELAQALAAIGQALADGAGAPTVLEVAQGTTRGSGFSQLGHVGRPMDSPGRLRAEAARRRRVWYTLAGSVLLLVLLGGLLVLMFGPGRRVHGPEPEVGGRALKPTRADRHPRKLSPADEAFERWLESVAGLPAEKQVEEVAQELKKRNPGFDGKVTSTIDNGTVSAMAFITDNVKDIIPLSVFKWLTSLSCNGSVPGKSEFCDLTPLTGMKLTYLECSSTAVDDLSALRGMPLTYLSCSYTKVSDLSPVQVMPLTTLFCQNTKVTHLSPLKDMKLTRLCCDYTPVADLSPLKGMPITVLSCTGTKVSDLSPLENMKLTHFYCAGTEVSDLAPLRGMPLNDLRLNATNVHDLSPLRGMPLYHLNCQRTKVSNLSPLKDMKLTQLDCTETEVSDLSPLRGMPLTYLLCQGTKVSDLSPLKGMPLEVLICSGTAVSDLGPLKDMKLTTLQFQGTRVFDLSPLRGMPLKYLHCQGTKVSDLSPLKGMPLTVFSCGGTKVLDLSPLKGMKLTDLNCTTTQVSELAPLRGMSLTSLDCHNTPISDLSPLKDMKLTYLDCRDTKAPDLSPLTALPLKQLYCDFKPARDAAALRSIKTLEQLNGRPAAAVWKELDAKSLERMR